MDKAALLNAIKDAEAKAAKDLEDARGKKQMHVAAAQAEAERIRREGLSAVDKQAADQVAEARARIEAERQAKLTEGRVKIRRKREAADARVPEVAEFLVQEFERSVQGGLQ